MSTSYFVTFRHSFLQLKCTWSGVSLKLGFRCSRIIVVLVVSAALSFSHLPYWWRFPLKTLLSHRESGPPSQYVVPWANPSPQPKRHLDRFSCFCMQSSTLWQIDRPADRPTNRQTDSQRKSVSNNRPHLHSSEMRPNNMSCAILQRQITGNAVALHCCKAIQKSIGKWKIRPPVKSYPWKCHVETWHMSLRRQGHLLHIFDIGRFSGGFSPNRRKI